jgi:hypothetical protein
MTPGGIWLCQQRSLPALGRYEVEPSPEGRHRERPVTESNRRIGGERVRKLTRNATAQRKTPDAVPAGVEDDFGSIGGERW